MKINKLNKNDKAWEVFSVLLLFMQGLIIFFYLQRLPEIVAIHFNGDGQPNGWGSKYHLWIPFFISLALYGFLTLVTYKPFIYKWRMTEKNKEEQMVLTAKMARTVKAFLILGCMVLTVFMLKNAEGKWLSYLPFSFLILYALIIPPCLYYCVKIARIQ